MGGLVQLGEEKDVGAHFDSGSVAISVVHSSLCNTMYDHVISWYNVDGRNTAPVGNCMLL